MKLINPKSIDQSKNPFILDVRTAAEFRSIHAPGSTLLPLHELNAEKFRALGVSGTCYIMCRSGHRAGQAATQLEAAGFSDVQVIEGGILAWDQAGLPVEKGAFALPLDRQVRLVAGLLVLTGAVLAYSGYFNWILLSGFVGAGLIFAALTDICPMATLIAKMPWNCACGKNVTTCSIK